ncbi:hypothetical protein ACJX0J_024532, partial [Zea mays]
MSICCAMDISGIKKGTACLMLGIGTWVVDLARLTLHKSILATNTGFPIAHAICVKKGWILLVNKNEPEKQSKL